MKKLILVALAFVASACSPNYPAQQPPTGLCNNNNCVIGDKPSMEYYSKFMVGVNGTCDKPAEMSFKSAIAQFVVTKDNVGFAELHLFMHADGKYNLVYAAPAVGTEAPAISKFDGTFYLENDKLMLKDFGMVRRDTDDQILVQPMNTTKVDALFTQQVSFVVDNSPVNEAGQTVAQYCASQAPVAAPVATATPAP